MSNLLLKDRVAVVSGASAGIGAAVASEFVRQGACVLANARRREKLIELQQGLREGPGKIEILAGDASEIKTIQDLTKNAEQAFGRKPDLYVVNAGRGTRGSIMTSDQAQWEELLRINVLGALSLMRDAGAHLLAQVEAENWPGRARDIVVLGSIVGRHVSPFSSFYGTSKFAVNSGAEALRRELGPKGIRVSLIEPAIVKSEFQAVAGYDPTWYRDFEARIGPVLEPKDVARSIVAIVSQPAHVHICDLVIRPTRQDYP